MPILLENLVNALPKDTEEKVSSAKDRLRQRIRDILAEETRLFLQRKSRGPRGRTVPINVHVAVQAGLPEVLQPADKQSIEERHQISIMLAPFRQTLAALHESGQHTVEQLIPRLQQEPIAAGLLDGRERAVDIAREYANFLLTQLRQFELTRFILRVDQDVLGVYFDRSQNLFDDPEPCIELYWGVIGLVARDLGVEVSDLTYVVLAHEFGHAFTNAGIDAAGQWWKTTNFKRSDHELKEGLAQFYTELVCQRIEDIAPGALKAYRALLPYQPAAYQAHTRWTEFTTEHVRSAMLEARLFEPGAGVQEFEDCLCMEKRRLSANAEEGARAETE